MAGQDVNLRIEVDTGGSRNEINNLSGDLKNLGKQGQNTKTQVENVGKGAINAGKAGRIAANNVRQFSYQIQDVAVQAGMGTDSLRILAQQGPQIASIFGPGGAVFGAVIAIGAGIAGALVPSLLNGKDAFEELLDSVEGLDDILIISDGVVKGYSERIQNLARINRDAAQVLVTGALIELENNIYNANQAIDRFGGDFVRSLNASRLSTTGLDLQLKALGFTLQDLDTTQMADVRDVSQEIRDLLQNDDLTMSQREQLVEIQKNILAIQEANGHLSELNLLEQRLADGVDISTEALTRQTVEGQRLVNTYIDQLAKLSMTEEAYNNYRLSVLGVTEAEREQIRVVQELIEQQENADIADQKRLDQKKQREAKYAAFRKEQHDALINFSNTLLQNESQNTQAMARLGLSLMDQEKRENATSIISNSYSAAMKAYEALAGIPIIGPALGAAAAGTIIAAGATYAAKSLQGRALGGQVRGGESYIVGERGPEVLTMGSSRGFITPNDQLRSQTVNNAGNVANVTFNITANDTAGFDELLNKRRGQIIGIVNQALNNSGRRALV